MNTKIKYTIKRRELRIKAKIAISDQILDLTIDTGAQISTLRPGKLFGEIRVNCDKKIPIIGIAKDLTIFTIGQIETQIYFNEIPFEHEFQIVQDKFNISNDGIIGNDFLMKYGATINYEKNEITLRIPQENKNKDEQTVIDLLNKGQTKEEQSSSSKKGSKNKNYLNITTYW